MKMQQVKSKTTYFMAFVGLCLVSKVTAWGGLFNRYNPAIMGDLGYTGGHGGYAKELFGASSAGEVNSNFFIHLDFETCIAAFKE